LTYDFKSVDFDIEGVGSKNERANSIRAAAVLKLMNRFPNLQVSLTLPVSRCGLDCDMLDIVEITPCDLVNLMVMDYGVDTQDMGQAAIDAARAVRAQTGKCIGLTPMIGVNDTDEIFSLDDARLLKKFIDKTHWVVRTSFWAIERDQGKSVSGSLNTTSGIRQKPFEFTRILK
jgi:chitinase